MRNLPHEDEVNVKSLTNELKLLKEDLGNPEIYAKAGEEQLTMWLEEIESIKKVINQILRTVRGN